MLDFTPTVDKHIPLVSKQVKRRYQQDWMSDSILKLIKRRDNALKQHKYAEYKHFRNKPNLRCKVCTLFKSIRLNLHKPRISLGYTQKSNWYRWLNTNIEGLKTDNTILQDDLESANALNKHFTNIVHKYSDSQDMSSNSWAPNPKLLEFIEMRVPPGNLFHIPPISETFVTDYLAKLDPKQATGIDHISAKTAQTNRSIHCSYNYTHL